MLQVTPYFIKASDHQALEILKHIALQAVQKVHIIGGKFERSPLKIDTTR